ncbi:alpha/beta fold hydrolase [Oryzomicrobium sp.]|uniref:alpha/beta fold hydrolase n=1 Tax=Oryzomicrobium sp. TaxID=1911578 RepID=UPI0025CF114D|nr:alpha/beta fold hydrolase [Oryzomicrobium sp.]MCE1243587.1 alpha/beta fold hydrolase [Oryzomicrobium sp.]
MEISVNGIKLAYDHRGDGPPVVFLHSLGADHTIWAPQIEMLRATHTCVAVDLRGHGGSEAPPGPYTLECLADDVAALMHALFIPSATIVGISLGGMVAMTLALRHPAKAARLVLADTTAAYPDEAQAAWPARIRQVEEGGVAPLVAATLERWFTAEVRQERPALVERVGSIIAATPVAGYAGCCHAIAGMAAEPTLKGRLPLIRCPALVVVGDRDAGTPPAMAEAIAAAIPVARLEVIEGAAHLSNLCRPDHFTQLLHAFLAEPPV